MKRVLVVEDDAFIALDLAEQLSLAGYQVVGPAMSVAIAAALLQERGCDAAVVDVNLGKETSSAIAVQLKAAGKPFIVLTGYSVESVGSEFEDAPVLAKPVLFEALLDALRRSLCRRSSSAPSHSL